MCGIKMQNKNQDALKYDLDPKEIINVLSVKAMKLMQVHPY